jgi:hypothetical protein
VGNAGYADSLAPIACIVNVTHDTYLPLSEFVFPIVTR